MTDNIMDREVDFISFAEAEDQCNHAALAFKMTMKTRAWGDMFPGRRVRKYADYRRRGWVFEVELPLVLAIRGSGNPVFDPHCCDCRGLDRPCGVPAVSGCKHLQKHARKALAKITDMLPKGFRVIVSTGGSTHYHFDVHGPEGYVGRAVVPASPRDADFAVTYACQKVRRILAG
jgi:hypothetical protein